MLRSDQPDRSGWDVQIHHRFPWERLFLLLWSEAVQKRFDQTYRYSIREQILGLFVWMNHHRLTEMIEQAVEKGVVPPIFQKVSFHPVRDLKSTQESDSLSPAAGSSISITPLMFLTTDPRTVFRFSAWNFRKQFLCLRQHSETYLPPELQVEHRVDQTPTMSCG